MKNLRKSSTNLLFATVSLASTKFGGVKKLTNTKFGKVKILANTKFGEVKILANTKFGEVKKLTNLPPGNTKGGSISVLLTSCLTGLESAV